MAKKIPSTPRVLVALKELGSASVADLAELLDLPQSTVSADLGGLHDYGYVTKYGASAKFDGPVDDYVERCIALVAEAEAAA